MPHSLILTSSPGFRISTWWGRGNYQGGRLFHLFLEFLCLNPQIPECIKNCCLSSDLDPEACTGWLNLPGVLPSADKDLKNTETYRPPHHGNVATPGRLTSICLSIVCRHINLSLNQSSIMSLYLSRQFIYVLHQCHGCLSHYLLLLFFVHLFFNFFVSFISLVITVTWCILRPYHW